MIRLMLMRTIWFCAGAVATAVAILIAAHVAHKAEAARGQETMGPGILTAFAFLAAPFGGLAAVLFAAWLHRRKSGNQENS